MINSILNKFNKKNDEQQQYDAKYVSKQSKF